MPRKNFVGMLLGGAAFLATPNKMAQSQSTPTAPQTSGATKIMIIRHAEKPVGLIDGIDASVNPVPNSPIPQGWQRAGALIPLFVSSSGPLPTPTHIFAPNLQPTTTTTTKRPFETITPLAAKLGITINATTGGVTPGQYVWIDYTSMTSDALACPGVVLIGWEHELIRSIANIILGNSTTVPQTWPSARFDIVWIFDLNPATKTYTFNQLPQFLLQGDLPTPLS